MFHLAILNLAENKLNKVRAFTESEISMLKSIFATLEPFNILMTSYYNVQAPVRDIFEKLGQHRGGEIQRLFHDYLSAFSAFVKFWETYLSRTYGKASENFNNFKKATNIAYDTSFAYRLLYALRNYTQHIGPLPLDFSSAIYEGEYVYFLSLLIEDLSLKEFKPKVREELEAFQENINLLELVEELFEIINGLNLIGLENSLNLNALVRDCERLFSIYPTLELIPGVLVMLSDEEYDSEFKTKVYNLKLEPITQAENFNVPSRHLMYELQYEKAIYIINRIKPHVQ